MYSISHLISWSLSEEIRTIAAEVPSDSGVECTPLLVLLLNHIHGDGNIIVVSKIMNTGIASIRTGTNDWFAPRQDVAEDMTTRVYRVPKGLHCAVCGRMKGIIKCDNHTSYLYLSSHWNLIGYSDYIYTTVVSILTYALEYYTSRNVLPYTKLLSNFQQMWSH